MSFLLREVDRARAAKFGRKNQLPVSGAGVCLPPSSLLPVVWLQSLSQRGFMGCPARESKIWTGPVTMSTIGPTMTPSTKVAIPPTLSSFDIWQPALLKSVCVAQPLIASAESAHSASRLTDICLLAAGPGAMTLSCLKEAAQ